MTYVSRDPFAREELQRKNVYTVRSCDFCGSNRFTRRHRSYLYKYRVESDGGRSAEIKGLFCSVGCMRAYHS